MARKKKVQEPQVQEEVEIVDVSDVVEIQEELKLVDDVTEVEAAIEEGEKLELIEEDTMPPVKEDTPEEKAAKAARKVKAGQQEPVPVGTFGIFFR